MELFIILLKGLASVSVFIYLKFIPFLEEGSQEAEEDSLPIKGKNKITLKAFLNCDYVQRFFGAVYKCNVISSNFFKALAKEQFEKL